MSGFQPLDTTKTVTNKDLAGAYNRLHDCVHNVGEEVVKLAGVVREDRHAANNSRQIMGERMARLEGALGVRLPTQADIESGERPKAVKRKLGGFSVWQALGALSGLQILFQWILPALLQFFAHLMAK